MVTAFQRLGLRGWLTLGCFVALLLCFVPGLTWMAYLSILFGSVLALGSAWESLRQRQLDVNLLMVLAAVGAVTVGRPEDAAMLLFLFSLSSTLEDFALGKTKSAIAALVKLRPQRALRVTDSGTVEVSVEELVVGDLVRVNSFERLPADGEVVSGESSVDASAMTGESQPVPVGIGQEVMGGTQNLEGTLTVRVSRRVGDSALDRIVGLVADAQENKASGERISAWFGQWYTILVLLAFGVSLGIRLWLGQGWDSAFYAALVLLVGMSPCALVISVPASTLSALAHAARRGILVRGGAYIEAAARVDFVAVDKTGTLTVGRPEMISGWVFSQKGLQDWRVVPEFMRRVAAVEAGSSHPLAKALVRSVDETVVGVEIRTIPGKGLVGTVDGQEIWVGNDRLLMEQGFELPPEIQAKAAEEKAQGRTMVYAAGSGYVALATFADEIRKDAREVLEDLRNLGVKEVVMLTGDKPETAAIVAKEVGIDRVDAALLPEDKVTHIQELARKGSVLMVGDGVNDAPSLAQATIGVAMGGLGSDVALEAADVVLASDQLNRIPELIRLGRRTKGVILANLVIAGTVIVVLILSSFLFKLPLPVAVVAHEGSTLLVILNGLRLLR
ncbi:heavy metal translocating P-type ATPase [bacterium]|nr:heavy metal translocating P-type ATPase [bacterium]